ncbi:MAG: glycosyltransferase family 4 protein, partial [Gemmatimonadaceae bacterium]
MRILIVNWNDRENPNGGGAEVHLHEIFGRIAQQGHTVDLLASGWVGCPPRVRLDGIDVHRIGTRYTFPLHARRYYRRHLAARNYDVLIEDLNKVPLYTPFWRGPKVVALVHHLFGETIFREANPPMASTVWLAERGLPILYRKLPFVAVSESTADDLVSRGIPRKSITVIYNGIDPQVFTPDASARSAEPLFAYVGRLKKYKGVDIVVKAFAALDHPTARLE